MNQSTNVVVPPSIGADHGPEIYFDTLADEEWPNGCWACHIPECDTYYGATPNDAYAAWLAGFNK